MSKRNIAYIKPKDPKFLQQLKQQIGYKEGPSVETKKQKLEDLEDNIILDEGIEREDERPQIVVVNAGDLTAEEVASEEKRLAKEIAEAPADLSKPVVFRKRPKPAGEKLETASFSGRAYKSIKPNKNKGKNLEGNSSKLSFNVEDEE